jgi:hypothetical protein
MGLKAKGIVRRSLLLVALAIAGVLAGSIGGPQTVAASSGCPHMGCTSFLHGRCVSQSGCFCDDTSGGGNYCYEGDCPGWNCGL